MKELIANRNWVVSIVMLMLVKDDILSVPLALEYCYCNLHLYI